MVLVLEMRERKLRRRFPCEKGMAVPGAETGFSGSRISTQNTPLVFSYDDYFSEENDFISNEVKKNGLELELASH